MKMKILFAIVFTLLTASWSDAATYWVSKSASSQHCVDNASDPGAGSSSLTITQGIGCLSAGDTLIIKAGTYSETGATIPTGSAGSPITIKRNGTDVVTIGPNNPFNFYSLAVSYVVIDGFVFDGTGTPGDYDGLDLGNSTHHITIQNNEIKNWGANGIQIEPGSHDNTIVANLVHGNGDTATQDHGLYIHGNSNIVERNRIYSNCAYGVQVYNGGSQPSGDIVRYNEIYSNAACGGYAGGLTINGSNHQVYNNIIRSEPLFGIEFFGGSGSLFFNNTVHGNNIGTMVSTGSSSIILKNNAITNNTTNFTDSGSGTTKSNNFCTTSGGATNCSASGASAGYVNSAGGDFSLTSGSPLIDAGTSAIASGVTACANGSAPDIGAIETLGTPTATVNGTAAVITVPNNCTAQMLPASSVTGWTFKKNGSGDTVTANSRSGSNSFAATLTSAFVGGDTCLFSYSQTGNTTSDNNIGNVTTSNQEVLAFTDVSCTNITSGTGTVGLSHWRVYTLQGSADTAWIAVLGCSADFTNCTVAPGSRLWVRPKLRNNSGTNTPAFNLSHRWRYNGGSYVTLTGSYVNGIKVLGTGTQLGTVINDSATLTQDQLTSDESTNVACVASRSASSIPSLTLNNSTESECAQAIDIATTATPGDTYEYCPFKDDGTALTCSTPIKLTIGSYQTIR